MSRSFLFLSCATLALLCSCGYDESPPPPADDSPEPPQETLVFVPSTPLQLDPGATAVLAVQVSPPRPATVLFGIVGDTKNQAFLSAESAQTDAAGKAYVSLTGAQTPGAFRVRAGLPSGPSVERAVSVSGQGFGTLLVTAHYTGTRKPTEWVASAWPDLLCSSLVPEYPTGSSIARGPSPLSLGPLAVGPAFAVVVRAGNVAAGCLDVPAVAPDAVRPITVDVSDLPVTPANLLIAELELDETDALVEQMRVAVESRLAEAEDPSIEVEWLVDALTDALPVDEEHAFDTVSDSYDIESVVADFLGKKGRLPAVFRSHLAGAALGLEGGPSILASFDPRSTEPDFVVFDAARVPADEAGFESEGPWSLMTDTDDSFVLSGDLGFHPVRWLGGIARRKAAQGGASFAETLGQDFSCEELGSKLTPSDGELYPGCETNCLIALCEDALELLFRSWVETDAETLSVSVAASGSVQSGTDGALLRLDGRYIGTVDGQSRTILTGKFSASAQ